MVRLHLADIEGERKRRGDAERPVRAHVLEGNMTLTNDQRLKQVLVDILLIDDHQYRDDYGPKQIETWDSLAMLNIATAVEQEFGFMLNQREMLSLGTIGDIKSVLKARGVEFAS